MRILFSLLLYQKYFLIALFALLIATKPFFIPEPLGFPKFESSSKSTLWWSFCNDFRMKGPLSGPWQFLATESFLKMIKNAFYFTSKVLFVLKIFKILSWLFGHAAKRLEKKDKVNFKLYHVASWLINNRNKHIAQYLEKQRQSDNENRQLIECNMRNILYAQLRAIETYWN